MRPVIRAALLFGAGVFCSQATGCKFAASASEVQGYYVLRKPEATIQLDLNPNMTYEERIRFPSGQTITLEGKWDFGLPLNVVELDGAANVAERLDPQH